MSGVEGGREGLLMHALWKAGCGRKEVEAIARVLFRLGHNQGFARFLSSWAVFFPAGAKAMSGTLARFSRGFKGVGRQLAKVWEWQSLRIARALACCACCVVERVRAGLPKAGVGGCKPWS